MVLAAVGDNPLRKRPLRSSDRLTYVIRGDFKRIWVQPCCLGLWTERRHLNEQKKFQASRMIQMFMKRAMCICPSLPEPDPIEIDWVSDFIENPHFLRPKFAASGKALPGTITPWKHQEDLKEPGQPKSWRTPVEGRAARCRRAKEKFQLIREERRKPKAESLSYLTVNCDDLPEDPVGLPERIRARNADRGNHFRANEGIPIQGAKTESEAAEHQKIEESLAQHVQRWREHITKFRSPIPKNKKGLPWSPRWPHEEPDLSFPLIPGLGTRNPLPPKPCRIYWRALRVRSPRVHPKLYHFQVLRISSLRLHPGLEHFPVLRLQSLQQLPMSVHRRIADPRRVPSLEE
jgi:hypothetical protein